MKRRYLTAFLVTALAGTGLHFLYELCPNPLFGLIAPVNESVWEHLKLLFWPFLAASWFMVKKAGGRGALGACMAAELLMPSALLGVYYMLQSGFGVSGLVPEIALYFAVLGGGFAFVYAHRESARFAHAVGVLAMLAAIFASCLLVFSIAAPDLPIFRANN